jgi:hypothetical protein
MVVSIRSRSAMRRGCHPRFLLAQVVALVQICLMEDVGGR